MVAPTGGSDSCPISFRLYASNDLFVNSKVLLHEEIDNTTWKTSNTIIWPEDDSSRNGMIIDINTAKDRYADTYQYGTPPTVNYNETYDLFVLIVQKVSHSSSFCMAEFGLYGQPVCQVPGTITCPTCWTPPPPPPAYWDGAIWAFNGDTVVDNNKLVDKVVYKPGLWFDDIPISSGTAITGTDPVHGDYVTLGSNGGTTPDNWYELHSPGFKTVADNFTGGTISFLWRAHANNADTEAHILQPHHQNSGGWGIGPISTDRIKWRAGHQFTYTYEAGDVDANGWVYVTIVYAENNSTSHQTTGGGTMYINNKLLLQADRGGADINNTSYLIGKYNFAGHGYNGNQPSGDLASLVIMNKPLSDINLYKHIHEYNKGTYGNYLDSSTFTPPSPKYSSQTAYEDRPAATEHVIHYYDGTIKNGTELVDHIGRRNAVVVGTQESGTTDYFTQTHPTIKCQNSFYKIAHRVGEPILTNKVTISFYYKTS